SGKTPKQAQIELPFAAIPAVIAGCRRTGENRGQTARCKLADLAPARPACRLAKRFDSAQRAATQSVELAGPRLRHALDRVVDVGRDNRAAELGIESRIGADASGGGEPRQANSGRAVAPLAWPNRLSRHAQVRPVVPRRVITLIFERDAFGCGIGKFLAAARRCQ